MLKINPEKDIKELEKFGFKPKYDEDTGELESYALGYESYESIKVKNRLIPFRRDYNEDRYYSSDIVEVLYDLIKADMVVKE